MRYSYEEWEQVVYEAIRDGYFRPRNGDIIICKEIHCNNCKFEPRCPDIGVGSTKGLGLSDHKKTIFEFYPELFLSGKL